MTLPSSSASRLTSAAVAARIPYANAAPYYALWADAPFAVRNLVPRELGREAEAGTVDLGLMATADFLRLRAGTLAPDGAGKVPGRTTHWEGLARWPPAP